jgi:hypothetical protein
MPTVTQFYHVISGQRVQLEATIGDGQAGGHAVFLGAARIAQGEFHVDADLGDGADLARRVLVVSSIAVDVLPETDHVSVRVVLTGGAPSRMQIDQAADAPANGALSFLTVITFVGDEP